MPTFAERLDALLPERDAAVFAANSGMEQGRWESSFVEALAIAYGQADHIKRLRAAVWKARNGCYKHYKGDDACSCDFYNDALTEEIDNVQSR